MCKPECISTPDRLESIYADPTLHICCLLPVYENGGDSTMCCYVDGRRELVPKSIKTVTRMLAAREGLTPSRMVMSTGARSHYTSPRTYGPHMTFAFIKCRQSVGKDCVYGQFNVAVPYEYHVKAGPTADTSYICIDRWDPIPVSQSPGHVKRKLEDALYEHCQYIRKMLARMTMSRNPQIIAELFIAWRNLSGR